MKEFWFWVAIVTLLIFLNFMTWMGLAYQEKRIKKLDVMCSQVQGQDKKQKPYKEKEE